jgi:hypothetical protein
MTGGGAATNSGIDFQNRVGALALVAMLTDLADLDIVGLGGPGEIPTQVRFETTDGIDDIVVVIREARILVQAKNTISLSTAADSEFAKVVRQFVIQFRQGAQDERYILAVSPGASGKIRLDLKKLCESYRLNRSGAVENPLTENERRVLETVHAHIDREFKDLTGSDCDENVRVDILRRIYVQTLDVADGGVTERLAVTALASVAITEPNLLWRNLVTICLRLARDRLSIDANGLRSRIGALAAPLAGHPAGTVKEADESHLRLVLEGKLSMGREVLLVRDEKDRVILTELRRFDEDGTRRVHFVNGHAELSNGIRWLVIRRTSTLAGMTRAINSDAPVGKEDEVILIPASFDDVDDEPAAQAHAAAGRRRLDENVDLLACLVCERQISEHLSYTVEIDEDTHPYEVGMVHRGCLRSTHRVLGVLTNELFAANPQLVDFDFRTWIKRLKSGQGIFNSLRERSQTGLMTIAWNPDNASVGIGGYGVAYELSDGSTRYVLARGKVHRMSKRQAERATEEMNQAIEQAQVSGDPLCADSRAFGSYSKMVSPENPSPPKVMAASARELTRATASAHNTVENFYAPLFYLADERTGQMFAIAGAAVLLTDPLRLGAIMENWQRAGLTLPAHATVILAEDRDFDLFMREAQQASIVVVIDPVFDTDANLIGGYRFVNIKEVVAQAAARRGGPS